MNKIKIIMIALIFLLSVFFSGCIESENGNNDNTTDNNNNNDDDNIEDNMKPIASADAVPKEGAAPLTVYFNSSGSYDPDGSIDAYKWDLGVGPRTDPGQNPIHSYMDPGNYTVKLYVQDNDGAWSNASIVNITVT